MSLAALTGGTFTERSPRQGGVVSLCNRVSSGRPSFCFEWGRTVAVPHVCRGRASCRDSETPSCTPGAKGRLKVNTGGYMCGLSLPIYFNLQSSSHSFGTCSIVVAEIPRLCRDCRSILDWEDFGSHGEATTVTQSPILKERAKIHHVPGAIFC